MSHAVPLFGPDPDPPGPDGLAGDFTPEERERLVEAVSARLRAAEYKVEQVAERYGPADGFTVACRASRDAWADLLAKLEGR